MMTTAIVQIARMRHARRTYKQNQAKRQNGGAAFN
jgi:hypothetical protein